MNEFDFDCLNANCYKILVTMRPGTYSFAEFGSVLERGDQTTASVLKLLVNSGFVRKSEIKTYYELVASLCVIAGTKDDFKNPDEVKATKEDRKTMADKIIAYLNYKTGKKFRPCTVNRKNILARMSDGYTEQDFIKVIDIKTYQWLGDAKMEEYLRPSTLFGSKFENYLNSRGSRSGKQIEFENNAEIDDYSNDALTF